MLMNTNLVTVYGYIVRHDEPTFPGRITIDTETGLIVRVERGVKLAADFVYGQDCLIFPGFSDVHIHAREDDTGLQSYKEDYASAAAAALHGGVVCVCAMPNTPNPVVNRLRYDWHRHRIQELDLPVVVLNYLGIDEDTSPLGFRGEYPYKLYFGKSVGSLTVTYGGELETILARYRGEHVSFHVEYEPIVQASMGGRTHSDRRPVECVNEGLRLLLPLIEKYQIRAKLCHWSVGEGSFDLIEESRDRGCDILLEVSSLHLLFDTSMTDADPALWMKVQMNPAIQGGVHRQQLIAGLKTDIIQMLATDHAPHTREEKYLAFLKFSYHFPGKTNQEIASLIRQNDQHGLFVQTCVENNTSGAPWLDTYALVCCWLMREHDFTPQDIARVAAYNPGQFANRFLSKQYPGRYFGDGFGKIDKGHMGSLTIINTKRSTVVRAGDLHTKVGWSPLEDWEMPGAVEAVFIEGKKY
jgi:dihydroorotase